MAGAVMAVLGGFLLWDDFIKPLLPNKISLAPDRINLAKSEPCLVGRNTMTVITPEEGEELQRLYAELPEAHARVAAALRTDPPAYQQTSEQHARLIEAERAVSAILNRIKELQGTAGQPWNA